MTAWSGLGVVYIPPNDSTYSSSKVNADLDYLYRIGVRKVRLPPPVVSFAGATATLGVSYANVLDAARRAGARGFTRVDYGPTFYGGQVSQMTLPMYLALFDTQILPDSATVGAGARLSLGNEVEAALRSAIASIASNGTTATVTTKGAHYFTTSNQVTISAATNPVYNGTFTISAVTTKSFNVTTSSAGPGEATTSAYCSDMTESAFQAAINNKALQIKGNGYGIPLSYETDGTRQGAWGAMSPLNLDYIGVNHYWGVEPDSQGFKDRVMEMPGLFGAKGWVSEFSTPNGYPDVASAPVPDVEWTRNLLRRAAIIQQAGIDGYLFCYQQGFGLNADTWEIIGSGGMHSVWPTLTGSRSKYAGYPAVKITRSFPARTRVSRARAGRTLSY